jgi:hypothetical protein
MAKRLAAKTGTYTKDGAEKGEYTRLGVLMQGNDGGEYMLLDPTVNLAGVLVKQNILAAKQGKEPRDSIMVSVFDDNHGHGVQQPQQGYQQPQQGYQQPPAQQPQQGYQQPQQSMGAVSSDVPF